MDIFKKPLSTAQEKECLEAMKNGCEEARRMLIEHNMRLVAHIIRKYAFSEQETDDLLSIGTIGLIKAVNTFDAERGNRLSSYAAKCIDNEILMLLRAEKKQNREVSLYEPIGVDKEGNEISLLDVIETGEEDILDSVCGNEDIARLYQGYSVCLKQKEQTVIRLRYGLFCGKEHTQKEIGRIMGISRSYVSRIEKSALEKLRAYMEYV